MFCFTELSRDLKRRVGDLFSFVIPGVTIGLTRILTNSSRFMVSLPILMFLEQVCLHLALELENVCASFIIYGLNWPCCLLWLMLLTACSAIIVLFSSRGWNWTMQKSGLDINEFFLWGNVLKQDQKIKYTIYRTTEKKFYLSIVQNR